MPDEPEKSGQITDAAKAIAAITEQVPIYQDAVQPAAKELGKGLHLVTKAVNAALVPLEGFVWGVEKVREFVHERVARKLENVPPDEIQPPKPHVGVPAIEALRYTGSEPQLADLYANLLATSMDQKTAYSAHPSFVDIIKNMSPDEARMMKFLSSRWHYPIINIKLVSSADRSYQVIHRHLTLLGIEAECEHPALCPNYMDNLERLGLVSILPGVRFKDPSHYKSIEEHEEIKKIMESLGKIEGQRAEIEKLRLDVTDLGKQFIRVCVTDKETQNRG